MGCIEGLPPCPAHWQEENLEWGLRQDLAMPQNQQLIHGAIIWCLVAAGNFSCPQIKGVCKKESILCSFHFHKVHMEQLPACSAHTAFIQQLPKASGGLFHPQNPLNQGTSNQKLGRLNPKTPDQDSHLHRARWLCSWEWNKWKLTPCKW